MARLISYDYIRQKALADPDSGEAIVYLHDIAEAPTVDAVGVVRCKDCKYYYKDKIKGFICRHPELDYDIECYDHWINANPDDFCSCGERKGGGSDV